MVAYDFGVKQNILRRLTSYGCKITVVPSTYPTSKVLNLKPDGILFSNGPGDPSAVPYAVKSVQDLVGIVPVFGICMGHQLLGQALGGTTFKMKFGHHGGNHPVRHLPTGRVEISAQVIIFNHALSPCFCKYMLAVCKIIWYRVLTRLKKILCACWGVNAFATIQSLIPRTRIHIDVFHDFNLWKISSWTSSLHLLLIISFECRTTIMQ